GQPRDRAGCPWQLASNRAKTQTAANFPADAAAELFPACCEPVLREWSKGATHARAESPRQSTFLLSVNPVTGARCQCAGAKDAPPLPRHRREPFCIHCLREDRPTWKLSRGSS